MWSKWLTAMNLINIIKKPGPEINSLVRLSIKHTSERRESEFNLFEA